MALIGEEELAQMIADDLRSAEKSLKRTYEDKNFESTANAQYASARARVSDARVNHARMCLEMLRELKR